MLKHYGINTKLTLIMLALIVFSQIIVGGAVVFYDRRIAYQTLLEELNVLAEIIADRTAASIVFHDPVLAEQNLLSLAARSTISSACVLDREGVLFAQYTSNSDVEVCQKQTGIDKYMVFPTYILLSRNIVLDGESVGELQITSDLGELKDRLNRIALLVALITVGVSLVVLLLSRRLVRRVSRPLLDLSSLVRKITRCKDYSIRATKVTGDEVGVLVDAVNNMLETIETQSHVLIDANQRLEKTLAESAAALHEAQDSLLRKERLAALGQLTGTVSHELRNPLGTIQASVDVLRSYLPECPDEIDRPLQRIIRNIHRCEVIINELLDYSRSAPPNLVTTSIAPWLNDVLRAYPGHDRISMDGAIDEELLADIDVERMRRAVINVLDNAMQACDARESCGNYDNVCRVNVHLACIEDRIRIDIKDTGLGISEAVIQKVFEPLFSTKAFGVGLGLAIVKQILEQHMGDIDISSEIGVGTVVTFWIPLKGRG